MYKVLIADDNKQIVSILSEYCKKNNFTVSTVFDGETALKEIEENEFDIILLDVMMPKKDGFDVCREVRTFSNVPIIMITARGEDYEKIMGLEIGADDYIVKPFAIEELLARLRALFRRIDHNKEEKNQSQQSSVKYRNLVIEKKGRIVKRDDQVIDLTKREYELLLYLMENLNTVLSREVLLDKVWGYKTEVETNVVDVYIRYLRNKIDVPGKDSYIQTVRGTGYVMRT